MIEPRDHGRAARSALNRPQVDAIQIKCGIAQGTKTRRPRLPVQLPDPGSIAEQVPVAQKAVAEELSDEQVAVRVHARLAELGAAITGRMVIRIQRDTILLQGIVRSHYERLVIIGCVRNVRPEMAIRDRLEILPSRVVHTDSSPRTLLRRWLLKVVALSSVAITSAVLLMIVIRSGTAESMLVEMPVTVQASGSPAAGAFLTLHPLHLDANPTADTQNILPQGRVSEDGKVAWTTFQPGDGLPPGEYIVTATWSRLVDVNGEKQPGPNLLARIYATADTSPLRLQVPGTASNTSDNVVLRFQ